MGVRRFCFWDGFFHDLVVRETGKNNLNNSVSSEVYENQLFWLIKA
jgi:hypothetical protein